MPISKRAHRLASALLMVTLLSARPLSPAGAQTTTNKPVLVSATYNGAEENNSSGPALVAGNGQVVAFSSSSTNLVQNYPTAGIFARNLATGTTTPVSVSSEEQPANHSSLLNDISADGRYVVFTSYADNLVPNDTHCPKREPRDYPCSDVFLRDLVTGLTERISLAADGTQGNSHSFNGSISADGRYVAFQTWSTNFAANDQQTTYQIFVRDRATGTLIGVPTPTPQAEYTAYNINSPVLSADGSIIAYTLRKDVTRGDVRATQDLLIYDLRTRETTRLASVSVPGNSGPDLIKDLSISADGRYIAFSSESNNLVPNDTNNASDIFVVDRITRGVAPVSVSSAGLSGNAASSEPELSADGRFVVFTSEAGNLVSDDSNGVADIFLHDRQRAQTIRVSTNEDGGQSSLPASKPSVSGDGTTVTYAAEINALESYTTRNKTRVYLRTPITWPTPPATAQCFNETDQCLRDRFLSYWRQNGGLAVFGYPTATAAYELNADSGRLHLAQWLERNRLELHPDNAAPYDVLLGRLGDERLRQLGIDWSSLPRAEGPKAGCLWFEETRHNVCDQAAGIGFKTYWETHGLEFDGRPGTSYAESLALFGLPLTEPRMETNSSGDTVLTQWFERARFEWHPDKPREYKVLLGLLGNEVLENR